MKYKMMTISEELIYEAVVVLQPLWVHSSTPIYKHVAYHQTCENDTIGWLSTVINRKGDPLLCV